MSQEIDFFKERPKTGILRYSAELVGTLGSFSRQAIYESLRNLFKTTTATGHIPEGPSTGSTKSNAAPLGGHNDLVAQLKAQELAEHRK